MDRKAAASDKEGWRVAPGDVWVAVAIGGATGARGYGSKGGENAGGGKAAVDEDADGMSAKESPKEGGNAEESTGKGMEGPRIDGGA